VTAADFAKLIDRQRLRADGKWWDGRCPNHDDQRSSLSWTDGDRGLIVECHAGCAIEKITAALGLTVKQLFHANGANGQGHHTMATERRIVAIYDYCDAAGALRFQVLRYEPKDFRCRRPDGTGGWLWNLTGVRLVPYRLPELAESVRAYIAEGEQDVDTLRALGFAATCNHGGAGKWRDEHTAALVAAAISEVIVIPDNDAPGEQHAARVVGSCRGAGLRATILRLPDLPPKGDVSDWVSAGHTAAELEALTRKAQSAEPIGPESSAITRTAIIVSAASIAPEVILWQWPGRIAVGALTNTVGLPDQGKTLLYCDITGRLTTGSPMPPAARERVREPQRVLILTLEDSLSATIVPRLIKGGADLEMVDFVRMVQNVDGSTSHLTLAEDLDVLSAALAASRYGLVIVDGIMGYLGHDAKTHNDADVRRVLTPFTELLDRAHVAGLSVMHPPKTVNNLAYYAGGSIAFTSVPRVALGVAPDPEDDSDSPRRFLMKIKGNLYGAVPTLAYHIKADGPAGVPWLEWDPDPVHVNIADVLDPPKEDAEDRSSRRACEEWLRSYLGDGPRPAHDADKAAKDAGFKPTTIRRARERIADVAKRGFEGGWVWLLKPKPSPR
jgi:putative DNA primase/helicase